MNRFCHCFLLRLTKDQSRNPLVHEKLRLTSAGRSRKFPAIQSESDHFDVVNRVGLGPASDPWPSAAQACASLRPSSPTSKRRSVELMHLTMRVDGAFAEGRAVASRWTRSLRSDRGPARAISAGKGRPSIATKPQPRPGEAPTGPSGAPGGATRRSGLIEN
jgi:hypothetical protein